MHRRPLPPALEVDPRGWKPESWHAEPDSRLWPLCFGPLLARLEASQPAQQLVEPSHRLPAHRPHAPPPATSAADRQCQIMAAEGAQMMKRCISYVSTDWKMERNRTTYKLHIEGNKLYNVYTSHRTTICLTEMRITNKIRQ